MDGTIDSPRGGLVRCFAEFALLPDLLDLCRSDDSREEVVEAWGRVLDEIGYNADPVENRFIPDGMTLTEFMADDALRFCRWIALIEANGGLSEAGEQIAGIAGTPFAERGREESQALTKILAEQTQRHYLGVDGLPLADLLQGASAILASHGRTWDPSVRGMLLAELDTLLHWGFADAATAESLARRLPSLRERVIDAMQSVPDVVDEDPLINALNEVNYVSELHWRDPGLAQGSELTATELKSTAMAMTFAQLLSQSLRMPAVQVLRPWVPA